VTKKKTNKFTRKKKMETRVKREQRTTRELHKEAFFCCTPFYIDVSIDRKQEEYQFQLQKTKKKLKREQHQKHAFEKALQKSIAQKITKKVTLYYTYADLEVRIEGVPSYYWRKMMRHWEDYAPKRKRAGFHRYKKTEHRHVFFGSFPLVKMDKALQDGKVMRITISSKALARALYDENNGRMVTFWYEPFPFPEAWFPSFRGKKTAVAECKKKCYWEEK
jgi:hypothetical protein